MLRRGRGGGVNEMGYQSILKEQLSKRCAEKTQYSLRAFALHLGIEPAQLSRVLNGKQNIPSAAASSIADKLFKQERERQYFVSLVELATAKKPQAKERALKRVQKFAPSESPVQLQLDVMAVISEWYHFAILDLAALPEVDHAP